MELGFLNDTLVSILQWLDAKGFSVACLTCQRWREIACSAHIWEKIVQRYIEGLSKEAKQWLFTEKELDRVFQSDKRKNSGLPCDRVKILQKTYRIFATAFIIVPGSDEKIITKAQEELTKGTSHHTVIRKQRVFPKISDAVARAFPGDHIFLLKGQYDEDLTIQTPVHIFGAIGQKTENNEVVNLLLSALSKSITWCSPTGTSSLTSCYLPDSSKITVKNCRVKMNRLVLTGRSRVIVEQKGDAKIWRCTMERCSPAITLFATFDCIDVTDTMFGDDDIEVIDLQLIIKRLELSLKLVPDPYVSKVVKGCVNTIGAIVKLKNPQLRKCLIDLNVVEHLKNALEIYTNNDTVLLAVVRTVNKFLLSDDPALVSVLGQMNMVPYLESMIVQHSKNEELQEWIPICLWNLVNQPKSRHHFQEKQIYMKLLKNLEVHVNCPAVIFEIVSFFWHSAHHLPPTRPFLIENLPKLVKVLEHHKSSEKLHKEVMGLIWNLPGVWNFGVTKQVLPHVLHTLSLTTNYASVNTTLGGFLIVTRRCPKEEIDFLVDNNVVQVLMQVKERKYVESEAENRLWKAITLIARNSKAQKVLTDLLVKDFIWPPLSEIDRFKISRAMTIHETIDSRLFEILENLINSTKNVVAFFFGLDAVVHLVLNVHLFPFKNEIKKLGDLVLSRSDDFLHSKRIRNWIGWAKQHITGEIPPAKFGMDPIKSAMMHIASNGCLCRHEFSGAFGTAIASHCVSSGMWYYEVEVITSDLFHIGWVTNKFVPDPTEGIGVGDNEHSWAIDLKKQSKWHLDKDGTIRQPYGKGTKVEPGGIVQCYLDLDKKIMSFGYNGENLGVAFENFDISDGIYAAVSTNLENECFLNFGEDKFRYPPPPEYRPLYQTEFLSGSGGEILDIMFPLLSSHSYADPPLPSFSPSLSSQSPSLSPYLSPSTPTHVKSNNTFLAETL